MFRVSVREIEMTREIISSASGRQQAVIHPQSGSFFVTIAYNVGMNGPSDAGDVVKSRSFRTAAAARRFAAKEMQA